MNRREFLTQLLLATSAGITSRLGYADDDQISTVSNTIFALATTNIQGKHVVVVGGGMAGATVAKYLRLWGGTGLSVTIIEPNPVYVSNIMSNLVLSANRTLASLNTSYANLTSNYGITIKQATVTSFDNTTQKIALSDGSLLSYDRLVLAPGIQFDDAYGLTATDYAGNYPHAWQAGSQTQALANQVATLQAGDTLVMSIPAKPYRCPPGPYERACLIADYLKTQGKIGAKVIVLDENPSIQAEPHSFTTAFNAIHAGWIDYRPNAMNIMVDKTANTVTYTGGSIANAKVISLIPPHRAPSFMSNLCNGGRWAPVNVLNYESTIAGMTGVHIIGDASSTTQPKAGHIANQEAKVCADAIIRAFQNQAPDSAPVTNSACYSPITNTTASWLTGVYQFDSTSKTMRLWANGSFTDAAIESADISSKNFSKMNTWFNTLMSDSFS